MRAHADANPLRERECGTRWPSAKVSVPLLSPVFSDPGGEGQRRGATSGEPTADAVDPSSGSRARDKMTRWRVSVSHAELNSSASTVEEVLSDNLPTTIDDLVGAKEDLAIPEYGDVGQYDEDGQRVGCLRVCMACVNGASPSMSNELVMLLRIQQCHQFGGCLQDCDKVVLGRV